jgi:hypothetical protein
MTTLGLLFMIASLTFVWGLTIWCFHKVLTAPPDEEFVEPPDSLGG